MQVAAVILSEPIFTFSLLALLTSSSFSGFLGTRLGRKEKLSCIKITAKEEKPNEVTACERAVERFSVV